MKLAYFCASTPSLAWPRRMLEEGTEVLVYMKDGPSAKSGQGIVPVTYNQEEWLRWGAMDPQTIYFFDVTENGEIADKLRKAGRLVINGGTFQDRLELDRTWGENLMKKVGAMCPPTYSFGTISEVIAFLQSNPAQQEGDGGWAWKADKDIGCDTTLVSKDSQQIIDHVEHIRRRFGDSVKCILQEKIKGVAVSTARWWNGIGWVGPYEGTVENKKFLNDNLGPATGCQFNVVWFYWEKEPRVAQSLQWDRLAAEFRKNNAAPGIYDINSIFNKKGAWFLEWTPRLGIDADITSQRGITHLSRFLEDLVHGRPVDQYFNKKQAYFDVNISVPPYPMQKVQKGYKSPAVGVPIRGIDGLTNGMFVMGGMYFDPENGFSVGEPCGNLGFVISSGTSMSKTYKKMYDWIKENLVIPDLQYRTDAISVLQKDIDEMAEYGFYTCPALRR